MKTKKKISLLIIFLVIFCGILLYLKIVNKLSLERKVDNLIARMQDNYFVFGKGDQKVFENTSNELFHMGEKVIPYLLNRIKKAGRKEGNIEYLSFMISSELYTLNKIGQPAVHYLIKSFEDKSMPNSSRMVLIDLLEQFHDERVIVPFVKVLLDKKESIAIRQSIAFNYVLSVVKSAYKL